MVLPKKKVAVKTAIAVRPATKPLPVTPVKPINRVAVAAKKAPVPAPVFRMPDEFKPHWLEITFAIEADGLIGSRISVVRIKGNYPYDDMYNIPDNKRYNLLQYDTPTMLAIVARLSARLYVTNTMQYPVDIAERNRTETYTKNDGTEGVRYVHRRQMRLPANTIFRFILRARSTKDSTLAATASKVYQSVQNRRTGANELVELDKRDPISRRVRQSSRIMPAAFQSSQPLPKRLRGRIVQPASD